MIVDFHTHVFSPRLRDKRDHYIKADPTFGALYDSPKARLATAEDLIAGMDRDGVAISVIANFGWNVQELCVETNDYIMESIARYPQRLVGLGAVQPRSGDAALKETERCARGGLKGIGEMRPDTQGLDLASDGMAQFVETLRRHNMLLLTHSSEPLGHAYPGKGGVTPEKLYSFIQRYPDLTVVCAHWGGGLPFYGLMPEVTKALAHVYFDTAASPFLYSPGIYRHAIDIVGAEKVLFGSDFPLMPQGRPLQEIRSLHLPAGTERLLVSGNARRLLGIGGA